MLRPAIAKWLVTPARVAGNHSRHGQGGWLAVLLYLHHKASLLSTHLSRYLSKGAADVYI